jgi:hypothetical protein
VRRRRLDHRLVQSSIAFEILMLIIEQNMNFVKHQSSIRLGGIRAESLIGSRVANPMLAGFCDPIMPKLLRFGEVIG